VDDAAGAVDAAVRQHHRRLPRRPLRLFVRDRAKPRDRPGRDHRVGVEEEDQRRARGVRPGPTAGGKAEIGAGFDHVDAQRARKPSAPIRRGVVDDHQLIAWLELRRERRHERR
jgi:hypothetical protein